MTSFLSHSEIDKIGFKAVGSDVKISRNAKFYSPDKITIGNNVRIDDFCILSGDVTIGNNIHISAYVSLYGGGGIILEDYIVISVKTSVFSQGSDWSGDFLVGVMFPDEYVKRITGLVTIKKFAAIGAMSSILPGVTINEGTCIGAMSFVKQSIPEWEIWVGNPIRFIKKRNRNLIELEKKLKESWSTV